MSEEVQLETMLADQLFGAQRTRVLLSSFRMALSVNSEFSLNFRRKRAHVTLERPVIGVKCYVIWVGCLSDPDMTHRTLLSAFFVALQVWSQLLRTRELLAT